MKLRRNCKCGKNDFEEVRTEKLAQEERTICRCCHCGTEVVAKRQQIQRTPTWGRTWEKGKDWDYSR